VEALPEQEGVGVARAQPEEGVAKFS
jgi:hypothetical protein